jgi:Fur family ferric uptake transcriptional regulator
LPFYELGLYHSLNFNLEGKASMLKNLQQKCSQAGLKMTGQRKTILQVLEEAEDHPSVETVYERAKEIDSSISIATVYRTLSLLDEMDLVIRHEFQEGYSRYELNWDHHHHLVDLESGEVVEFQNEELEKLKEKIAKELGYQLIDHRLELYGKKLKK